MRLPRLTKIVMFLWGMVLVLVSSSPIAQAQIAGLDFSVDTIASTPNIPIIQLGDLEVAPVFLDGRAIVTVASQLNPTPQEAGQQRVPPAAFRSQQITRRLALVLARMNSYSRKNLQSIDAVDQKGKQLASELVISSRRIVEEDTVSYRLKIAFPKDARPELIVNLTDVDAQYTRQSFDELPQYWRQQLVKALIAAWRSRQPSILLHTTGLAVVHLLTTSVISTALWLMQQALRRKRQRQKIDAFVPSTELEDDTPDTPLELLRAQIYRFNSLRDRNFNHFWRRLLFWGQLLLWVLSLGLLCRLFYFTRPIANWLLGVSPREWFLSLGQRGVMGTPIVLLLLFLMISLGDRLMSVLIERIAREWLVNQADYHSPSQRFPLRVPTLVTAAQGVTRVLAYSIFLLIVLNQFRAISTPLTALLGIITFAISLGAQNFIKDVINGTLILIEDQYAVGDVIAINGDAAGLVEAVNLRITQLRNLDGELITIPNGSISIVRNMTSEWSQAKCSITISHKANVEQAMEIMGQVAQALYQDDQWRDRVLDQPELLGIEQIDHHGTHIWILLKTQPMQHWNVVREYRRRLHAAFTQAEIEFGYPRQEVRMQRH